MTCLMTYAQTTISGDLFGVIRDPTGAFIPGATVELRDGNTGQLQTTTTNEEGLFRFTFLKPGAYTVAAGASGFARAQSGVRVSLGQVARADLQLNLAGIEEQLTVSLRAMQVNTENGDIATSLLAEQVALVPNPGGDLTNMAQTAPGVVMNTQSGWGNFVAFGTTSFANIYTLNGQNQNDSYVGQAVTGATNMLLGQNEVQEMTIVTNGYLGQHGTAGATVNYVTKSGGNDWHGNAVYSWDGRALNANNFFNKRFGTDRPFVNVNEWAGSLGGPVKKDKLFFFVNNEGHRMVIPTSQAVRIPSPQFDAVTVANLQAVSPGSVPFYQRMFTLWNNAPGAASATDTLADNFGNGHGCPEDFTLGGAPCALEFQSTAGNLTYEWLLTGRVDWNIGAHDTAFLHFRTDHGSQAANSDPISPLFSGFGTLPSYQGQINETHTFGSQTAHQFIVSGSWYSALWKLSDGAEAFPEVDGMQWQPRLGFSWSPFGDVRSTVVRGGMGRFADGIVPGNPLLYTLGNPPSATGFYVAGGALSPDIGDNMMAMAAAANAPFRSSFASGGTLKSMSETNPRFVPPSLGIPADHVHYPRYREWSLELQQGLGRNSVATLKYVGNHGIREIVANPGWNAYCDTACLAALGSTASAFAGLPPAVPDARFGSILQLESTGVSNYNGLVLSIDHRSNLFTVHANYAFSHALDDLSNSGVWFSEYATNWSVVNQVDPRNLHRYNYGNAAYDVRHYASMNWVLQLPHRIGPKTLLSGWTLAGTLFVRSGFPFTVTDSTAAAVLAGDNYSGAYTTVVFANVTGDPAHTCGRAAVDTTCLNLTNFHPALNGFGAQSRNQFYGPGFFNMDLGILKEFDLPLTREGVKLTVSANLFNALNHPNFDQPVADIRDPSFGTIRRTVNAPTGIFGAALGGDNSPRLVQLTAGIRF